jgi:predicted transcriptional regulator
MKNKEGKVNLIKKLCKEYNITAYEIGLKCSISKGTAYNILSKSNISPREKTLDKILKFINETYINPSTGITQQYTPKENFNSLSIEDKLNIIYNQNIEILSRLNNTK